MLYICQKIRNNVKFNNMNHKEEMEQLKENDPIAYYELTSNPTGAEPDGCGGELLLICIIASGIILSIKYFL